MIPGRNQYVNSKERARLYGDKRDWRGYSDWGDIDAGIITVFGCKIARQATWPMFAQIQRLYVWCCSLSSTTLTLLAMQVGINSVSMMFYGATAFNQDISGWDTSNVTNMSSMIQDATSFNQDISAWNTSNVTNMGSMFRGATVFNQNLSTWKVPKITSKPLNFDRYTSMGGIKPIDNHNGELHNELRGYKPLNLFYLFSDHFL